MSRAAFVFLTSLIVVIGSERIYWYGAGFGWSSIVEMAAFYVLPATAGLWAMAWTPARGVHQVVLAGAVFAFVVEGVLTTVVYSDGPLPLTAAMFVGWHGMLAFVLIWYLFRRWLVEGRRRALSMATMATGTFWGVWALAGAVGDVEASGGAVLDPLSFAGYATGVGAVLAAAHLSVGWVWPTGWRPSRGASILLGVASVAYFSVAVLPAVPWAPMKLAALLGGTAWLLRRSRASVDPATPTVLDRLAGTVSPRSVLPILLTPATASIVYGIVWTVRATPILMILFWGLVVTQIAVGAAAYLWAACRSLRRARSGSRDDPPNRRRPRRGDELLRDLGAGLLGLALGERGDHHDRGVLRDRIRRAVARRRVRRRQSVAGPPR